MKQQHKEDIRWNLLEMITPEMKVEEYRALLDNFLQNNEGLKADEVLNMVWDGGSICALERCLVKNNPELFAETINLGATINRDTTSALLYSKRATPETKSNILLQVRNSFKDEIVTQDAERLGDIIRMINQIEFFNGTPEKRGEEPFKQFLFDHIAEFRQELGKSFADIGGSAEDFENVLKGHFEDDGSKYGPSVFLITREEPREALAEWKKVISNQRSLISGIVEEVSIEKAPICEVKGNENFTAESSETISEANLAETREDTGKEISQINTSSEGKTKNKSSLLGDAYSLVSSMFPSNIISTREDKEEAKPLLPKLDKHKLE